MSSDQRTFQNYLRDLGYLLRERAREAALMKATANDDEKDYAVGHLMAYYEVISLMRNQALSFQISPRDLVLEDLDPDEELV